MAASCVHSIRTADYLGPFSDIVRIRDLMSLLERELGGWRANSVWPLTHMYRGGGGGGRAVFI